MSKRWNIFDKHFEQEINLKSDDNNPDQWQDVIYTPNDNLLPDSSIAFQTSFRILKWIIIIAVVALVVRLAYLQFAMGDVLFERGQENYLRIYVTRAMRGIIYDREQIPLVENIPHDSAAIIPADLPNSDTERDALFHQIATILDISVQEIADISEKYRFLYTPIIIKSNIDHESKLRLLSTFPNQASGVTVIEDFSRKYLSASTGMSHAMGYLGKINDQEWQNERDTYTLDSNVGRTGIENSYEEYLRGTNGQKKIVVNAKHSKIDTLFTSEPENGCDLVTTFDSDLQNKVYRLLKESIRSSGATGGSVVIMNPQNGQILSLISLPDFDNNLFIDGIKGKDEVTAYERLTKDKNTPFLNRAISGAYPPGSTFKLVTAASVLENNIVSANDHLDAPGFISVPNQFRPDENFIYKDWKDSGHGSIDIVDAIAESSDTFFYKVSGGYQTFQGVGTEKISEIARKFGLGSTLGIDLPNEVSGTVPTSEWKKDILGLPWVTGDTYNYAIGQGYLLTTPLQVAAFTSVIANNGKLYQPYIVKEISNCELSSRKEPKILSKDFLKNSSITTIAQGMYEAVYNKDGTAKSLQSLPFKVAGKTGTAQFNNNQDIHAWFTAYAPFDNPEIVVTVMLEGGGEGSQIAVPIAKQILSWWHNAK
ncbi:MAG: penicillin-binding protein 2 [Candidatus Abawacabacteria bacterium RBG_16_42_10]|uniref:Penicillin-binding protein 2 n=1 Tax=Candidatus Abawacabacteria bacterium RBG_16_42_10 TaxID=1817814 RepID=A0A1F4XKW3_9BACT|nr:MAG: penicillin-binding protein 2 [Candidatus Abawacabacteria bacterium RBG_16_42_10]